MEIIELYEYSRAVRRSFAKKLSELPWDDVSKNREASFYSMKNILLHMIDNEDWIVNYAIFERSKEYTRRKSEEYSSMETVLEHLDKIENRTKEYFAKFGPNLKAELDRRVQFEISSGRKFDLSVEECLFQSFTEQLYHLGELIALLWQQDIEPPQMQWFYNNPRAHARK